MKKVLSILAAVLVMSVTFAQSQVQTAPIAKNHVLMSRISEKSALVRSSVASQVVASEASVGAAPLSWTDVSDTIEVVLVYPRLHDSIAEFGWFQIDGYNADSSYYATFSNKDVRTSLCGTYEYSSFFLGFSCVRRMSDNTRIRTLDGHAEMSETEMGYFFEAYYLGEDTHCYHVVADYVIPYASDTIDVNIPVAHLFDYQEFSFSPIIDWIWSGTSDDEAYNVFLFYKNEYLLGDYDWEKLRDGSNINQLIFLGGEFSVRMGAEPNVFHLETYLIGEDYHCYHIMMTYTRPTMADATDTIHLNIPEATFYDGIGAYGFFQMHGTSDDGHYTISVTPFATQVPGTYDYGDWAANYTFINDDVEQMDIRVMDGHASVVATEDAYVMEAYMLGEDLHCYHATLTYTLPVATDTIEFVVDDPILTDMIAEQGWFQMSGWTEDSNYYATFSNIGEITSVAGTYDYHSFDPDYTYVVVVDGEDTVMVGLLNGHVTVTETEGGYRLEAYFLGADLHCYHVIMNYGETGINVAGKVQVNVYPNPATEVLHVEAEGINRVEVLDATGRVVLSRTQVENTVNIGSLANGLYLLRTTTVNGVNVQKIVKK